jgi:hypothetical protein
MLRSRTARRLSLLATFVFALVLPAQAAFAQIVPAAPPVPVAAGTGGATTPGVVMPAATGSGLASWIVVVIVLAAIVVGAGMRELVRWTTRRRPTTAQSY